MKDMNNEPWEKQKREKYEHHDFVSADFGKFDIESIKQRAIHAIVNTKENDPTKLLIESFMAYLSVQGFRIVKKEKT